MNGRFLLDTNALIALLGGHPGLSKILSSAKWVGISVISELEFLSFSGLSENDKALFMLFKERIEVLNLDGNNELLMQSIVRIRQGNRVKLPDAIIAATASIAEATLLSNDVGFDQIHEVQTLHF